MKTKSIIAAFFVLLLAILLPARGSSNMVAFTIERADETMYVGITPPNAAWEVDARFLVEHANAMQFLYFNAIPQELLSRIQNVTPRFTVSYANGMNFIRTGYPKDLLGDNVPPQVSSLLIYREPSDMRFTLTCNELCKVACDYGKSSGYYTSSVRNDLFQFIHQLPLGAASSGEGYYFTCSITDRSGNTEITREYTTLLEKKIFLPMARR